MERVQGSIYSLCPLYVSGLPQSLQTFLYNWLTSSFKSLQYALKTNLVTLQMETTSSSEMLKFIHNSTQYHNPKAIIMQQGIACLEETLRRKNIVEDEH